MVASLIVGRPRRAARAVVAAVLFAAFSANGLAADKVWTPYGAVPADTPIFGLVNDPVQPTTVYAATMGAGLLRTDDGKVWHDVDTTLPRRVWKVATDASKGPQGFAPVYVGSAGSGFFKSHDGGRTFHQLNKNLATPGSLNVRAIALGRGWIVIGTTDGVFKSSDGGENWQSAGLGGEDISSVAFGQLTPPVILAGVDGAKHGDSRLLLSKDLGVSWSGLKQGIPADMVVSAIASGPPISAASGTATRPLFVAGSSGVYKSDDLAQSWGQLAGLPAQGFGALALSPIDPNFVYVASDGSAGSAGGVWRSVDRGGTWIALQAGLAEHSITALSLGRNSPANVVAAAYNPDTPAVIPYELEDTQAAPQGQPEEGVCPEPSTQCPSTPIPPPLVGGRAVTRLALGAAPCPASSTAAATPSPAASASPQPSPSATPCVVKVPQGGGQGHSDLPVGLAAAILGLLLVLLIGRIVLVGR